MTANSTTTERVQVQIKVQKGLLGYPVSPAQYYVAVVGNGPQLGQENPNIAPRCKLIGNNTWVKEIWVPQDSLVSFKFLIVHAPTNTIVETEETPCHRIYVRQEPVIIETRFNQAGVKGGRGFCLKEPPEQHKCHDRYAVLANQEIRIEAEKNEDYERVPATKQRDQQREGEENIEKQISEKANDQERNVASRMNNSANTNVLKSKPSDIQSSSEHADSNGAGDDGRDKRNVCKADIEKVANEIKKDFKLEKELTKKSDMFQIQFGINKSVFDRFNLHQKDMDRAAKGIGLKPIRSSSDTYHGNSHQQLWLPKDMLLEFLSGKPTNIYKLTRSNTETKPVKFDDVNSSRTKYGIILPRKKPYSVVHTGFRKDKSLRQIITGDTGQTSARTLDKAPEIPESEGPNVAKALPFGIDRPSKHSSFIMKEGNNHAVTKKEIPLRLIVTGYTGPTIARTLSASSLKPSRSITENEIAKAPPGVGKLPEPAKSPDTGKTTDQATASELTEPTTVDLNSWLEENDVDSKEIKLEKSSISWKIPLNKKGLLLAVAGVAGVAVAAYMTSYVIK